MNTMAERGTRRPQLARPASGPDPEQLARLLTQVWFEVECGRRPFSQLSPLVTPALRRRLLALLPSGPAARRPGSTRIRKVISNSPSETSHEAAVLVERDGRVTAIAVRLERHRGAWRVVEMTAPEAGLAPMGTAGMPAAERPRDAFDEAREEAEGL